MNDLERILNLAGVHYEAPVVEETETTERELKEGITSLKCKHCGDMLGQPTTDCAYDSMDPKGDNWIMVDIDGDGDADIAVQQEDFELAEASCGCCNEDPCGCDDDCECKMNEASCGSNKKHKHESVEEELEEAKTELEEEPNEGNEFTDELKKAKDAGEDEFEVDGKKYKVKESEEQLDEIQAVDNDTGEVYTGPNKGKISKRHLTKKPYDDEALRSLKKEEVVEEELEEISEAPTMDTTQLIHLLKLSGISEEKINEHIEKLSEQWANTPDGVGEKEPTVHGDEDNYNFAQAVNLSLKRYLDAQDMKVSVNESHTVEGMKAKYDAIKNK